jgi:hypothetical protein
MRKITIEVILPEPVQPLDQNQKDWLDAITNAGEVQGRGSGETTFVICPYCSRLSLVDRDVLESWNWVCPFCGARFN